MGKGPVCFRYEIQHRGVFEANDSLEVAFLAFLEGLKGGESVRAFVEPFAWVRHV